MSGGRDIAPQFFVAAGQVWRLVGASWDAGGCIGRVVMARPVKARYLDGEFKFAGDQEAIRLADAVECAGRMDAWRKAVRLEEDAATREGAA